METELSRVVDALPGLVWTALPGGQRASERDLIQIIIGGKRLDSFCGAKRFVLRGA